MVSKAKNLLVLTSSSQKSANFAKDFGDRISPKEYNKNPKNSLQIRDRSQGDSEQHFCQIFFFLIARIYTLYCYFNLQTKKINKQREES